MPDRSLVGRTSQSAYWVRQQFEHLGWQLKCSRYVQMAKVTQPLFFCTVFLDGQRRMVGMVSTHSCAILTQIREIAVVSELETT